MELFHLLTYVLAVVSGLIAAYSMYTSMQSDKMINDLYKQIGLLRAEIKEMKGNKK